ncbi:hypothetical protein QR680_018741 [Steinernema hermaphroditum]|uniref:Secreted protein n=1 Tax=Steinernema hermaphroditum TaxID=289476 RepID=A0AA39LRJ8_9BILA|nr:hypothetical protein QR680_018741 [Steinernema hermaphroditum]
METIFVLIGLLLLVALNEAQWYGSSSMRRHRRSSVGNFIESSECVKPRQVDLGSLSRSRVRHFQEATSQ